MGKPINVRGLRTRKKGEPVAAIFVYVPPDVAQRARIRAVTEGTTLSALVSEGLRSVLGLEHGPRAA